MNQDATKWFQKHQGEVLDHLCAHLVGISWVSALEKPRSDTGNVDYDRDVQLRQATSFLLEANEYPFLITAGHVLQDIKHSISPPRRLIKSTLHCGIQREDNSVMVSTRLDALPSFIIDDEALGVDYGAMLLDATTVDSLLEADCRPVPEDSYRNIDRSHDIHVLLGFPKEHRQTSISKAGTTTHARIGFGTPLQPIQMLDEPPDHMEKKYDRFYGRLIKGVGSYKGEIRLLLDLNGMSGGPVFGLRIDDTSFEYDLIGIQSSWDNEDTIAACLVEPFAVTVGERTEEWLASLNDNEI